MPNYEAICQEALRLAAPLFDLDAHHIHVALVGDEQMSQLNMRYRKINKPTDVLTFRMNEPGWIGDIVIALPYARRQAKIRRVWLADELKRLVVHGVAHLAGYEHDTITSFSNMRLAELAALQKVIR